VGRIGSEVRVFKKIALLVGLLESGPRFLCRIRSEVWASDSFHILSCAVALVVVWSWHAVRF